MTPIEVIEQNFGDWHSPEDILAALSKAGYAVVPKEPTDRMRLAADDAMDEQYAAHPEWEDAKDVIEELHLDDIYRAMIQHSEKA